MTSPKRTYYFHTPLRKTLHAIGSVDWTPDGFNRTSSNYSKRSSSWAFHEPSTHRTPNYPRRDRSERYVLHRMEAIARQKACSRQQGLFIPL